MDNDHRALTVRLNPAWGGNAYGVTYGVRPDATSTSNRTLIHKLKYDQNKVEVKKVCTFLCIPSRRGLFR